MPITKSAVKKLRHDRARAVQNEIARRKLKSLIKKTRKSPTSTSLSEAFSGIDKAAKHRLLHANAAGRIKSRLSKLLKK